MDLEGQALANRPVAHEAENAEPCYEVCTEGSLTYFRYYLNDENDKYAIFSVPPSRPVTYSKSVAIALAGAGIMLISFAVGVAFARSTHQSSKEKVSRGVHRDIQIKQIEAVKANSSQAVLPTKQKIQMNSIVPGVSRPEIIVDPNSLYATSSLTRI